jgi:exodeoxyribonuclease VII small subunit
MTKKINFEQAMKNLETIVQQLEKGDLSLDESLKIYEQGIKLAGECQKTLTQADQKVAILSQLNLEQVELENYLPEISLETHVI